MDDTRLGAVLHEAFDVVEVHTARLVDGALRRSRRRARTARLVAGASAVMLVSAIVAVIAVSTARPAGPAPGQAAASRTVARTPTATTTSATPIAPTSAAPVATTPQALLQIALDTLPRPGDTNTYSGRRDDESGDVYVATEFRYDDGHGAAQVDVSLETGGESPDEFCANPLAPCTRPAAHTTLSVYQGNSRPGDSSTARQWGVDLFRADGVHVSISEWNAPIEKDAAPTRAEPPFTREQLIAWAGDDAFTMRVPPAVATAARHLFTP